MWQQPNVVSSPLQKIKCKCNKCCLNMPQITKIPKERFATRKKKTTKPFSSLKMILTCVSTLLEIKKIKTPLAAVSEPCKSDALEMERPQWPFCIFSSDLGLVIGDRNGNFVESRSPLHRYDAISFKDAKCYKQNIKSFKLTWDYPYQVVRLLTDIFYTPFASVWREIDTFNFFYNKNYNKNWGNIN